MCIYVCVSVCLCEAAVGLIVGLLIFPANIANVLFSNLVGTVICG